MRALHTAAALAAAVTVGIGTTSACAGTTKAKGSPSPPSGAPPGLASYYGQHPDWTNCQGGFECASIKVPLNYADPRSGGDLKLALIRLPARDKSHRIGSLVTNPGGPGGSGVEFVRDNATSFSAALRARFDLVGFDPRGVGASDPVRCLNGKQLDRYIATDSSPDNPGEVDALVAEGKQFAGGCEAKSARLLPYVGTTSAARDMDVLRAALGDRQLTYFGASYGTYLGAFYANLFPKNVRALVLDGAIDPKLSVEQVNLEQAKGFERALRAFADDCVRSGNCPLGGDTDAVLNKVSGLLSRTDQRPLNNGVGDGRVINEPMVATGIAAALYQKEAWPTLRLALSRAVDANDGTLLLKLADLLTERKEDGSYSNLMESNMAVNCVDKPFPTNLRTYEKDASAAQKAAPRFGTFIVWGSLPCAYWPIRASEPPRPLAAAGAKPILVVGTTRDPATPYDWAKSLASELQSGVLLSLDGDGHTAYLAGNRCIGQHVDRYLIDGIPPKKGTLCH